ncbi:MAG: ABC transporter permease, partial [Alicyclobacillus sp.]|nr:ABC transporter permease [Alicyclobacillus sp.]
MPFLETLRVSFRSIRANKVRAILTMLGIIIGVASVIALSAVGRGATVQVTKQVQSLGSNLLTISPGAQVFGGINYGLGSVQTLTVDDIAAIQDEDPDVAYVSGLVSKNAQLIYGPNNDATQVQGVNAAYLQIHPTDIQEGRFFTDMEVQN